MLVLVLLCQSVAMRGGDGCVCTNTCARAHDGSCDDGGPGSAWGRCPAGSDCADCGPSIRGLGTSPGKRCAWQDEGVSLNTCPAGTYQTAAPSAGGPGAPVPRQEGLVGRLHCTACKAGQFNPAGRKGDCRPCAPGQFARQMAGLCNACPRGKWQPARRYTRWNRVGCALCDAGWTTEHAGASACASCPKGKFSSASRARCLAACAAGSFIGNDVFGRSDTCRACPAGKYQPQVGFSFCSPCQAGAFFSHPGATSCAACASARCPPRQYRRGCGAGSLVGECACPKGRFKEGVECYFCPKGKFRSEGGTGPCADCGACPAPHGGGGVRQRRVACGGARAGRCICPAGRFKHGRECPACAAGQYMPEPGANNCVRCTVCAAPTLLRGCSGGVQGPGKCVCPAGTHMTDGSGADRCKACPKGRFSSSDGVAFECLGCTHCPHGQYRKGCDAAKGSVGTCHSCTALACPDPVAMFRDGCGTAARPTSTGVCVCRQGTFLQRGAPNAGTKLERTDRCIACPHGKYRPQGAAGSDPLALHGAAARQECTLCTQCGEAQKLVSCAGAKGPGSCFCDQPGMWTSGKRCKFCAFGRYKLHGGHGPCLPCSECGSHQKLLGCHSRETPDPTAGPGMCELECGPGHFHAIVYWPDPAGTQACKNCPAGKFNARGGRKSCGSCAAGKHQPEPAATSCLPCFPGQFSSDNLHVSKARCLECAVGQWQAHLGASKCKGCPAGRQATMKGATECENTRAPTPAPSPSPTQFPSPAPTPTTPAPTPTPPPSPVPPCTPGFGRTLVRDTRVPSKIVGHTCAICPFGKYGADGIVCHACPAGRFGKGSRTKRCAGACARGRYGLGGNQNDQCSGPCPVGKYGAGSADADHYSGCANCPRGMFQSSAGKAACVWCPLGKHNRCSSIASAAFAGQLAAAQKAHAVQLKAWKARKKRHPGAPKPKATPLPQPPCAHAPTQGCHTCASGTAGGGGDRHCTYCGDGQYAPARTSGVAKCLRCPAGKYDATTFFASTSCATCPPGQLSGAGATACSFTKAPTPPPTPPTPSPTPSPTSSPTPSPTLSPTPPTPSPTPPTPRPTPAPSPPTPPPTPRPTPRVCHKVVMAGADATDPAAGCMGAWQIMGQFAGRPYYRLPNVAGRCGSSVTRFLEGANRAATLFYVPKLESWAVGGRDPGRLPYFMRVRDNADSPDRIKTAGDSGASMRIWQVSGGANNFEAYDPKNPDWLPSSSVKTYCTSFNATVAPTPAPTPSPTTAPPTKPPTRYVLCRLLQLTTTSGTSSRWPPGTRPAAAAVLGTRFALEPETENARPLYRQQQPPHFFLFYHSGSRAWAVGRGVGRGAARLLAAGTAGTPDLAASQPVTLPAGSWALAQRGGGSQGKMAAAVGVFGTCLDPGWAARNAKMAAAAAAEAVAGTSASLVAGAASEKQPATTHKNPAAPRNGTMRSAAAEQHTTKAPLPPSTSHAPSPAVATTTAPAAQMRPRSRADALAAATAKLHIATWPPTPRPSPAPTPIALARISLEATLRYRRNDAWPQAPMDITLAEFAAAAAAALHVPSSAVVATHAYKEHACAPSHAQRFDARAAAAATQAAALAWGASHTAALRPPCLVVQFQLVLPAAPCRCVPPLPASCHAASAATAAPPLALFCLTRVPPAPLPLPPFACVARPRARIASRAYAVVRLVTATPRSLR